MRKNIQLLLVTILLLSISLQVQNITNTLAASGVFKIKDGATDYLSLDQSTGNTTFYRNLELGGITSSTSTVGVLTKNGARFIHNYSATGTFLTNTFIGLYSGNFNLSANSYHNTGVGYFSLYQLTNGYQNSAFGYLSLRNNSEGNFNSAFGVSSLESNTIGNANSAFGKFALRLNTTGNNNSAFGLQSLSANSTGSNNSAFGTNALFYNSTGSRNSSFGYNSLQGNSTGYDNSAFGFLSLYLNTTGKQNTAVGNKSLCLNVSGFQNTAVGDSALYNNTGNYNTAIGYNTGSNVTTGANLTLIGIDANPSSPTSIDQITLGNIYVSSLRCNVQTITSLSDVRDKKNIQDLTLGLDFIIKLKPRQFNWDKRDWYEGGVSDGSKMQETPTAGFIAQEFDEIQKSENAEWLNLVLKDNPNKWEATYGNLLPVVVKAIQELKAQKDFEIEQLRIENEKLNGRIANFEETQAFLVKKLEQIESNNELFKVQLVNTENKNE